MSYELGTYLLRLTVIWLALSAYYWVVLRRNANWRTQNWYLLGAYLTGILLPLLPTYPDTSVYLAIPETFPEPFDIQPKFETYSGKSVGPRGVPLIGWSLFGLGCLWNLYRLLQALSRLDRIGCDVPYSFFQGWRVVQSPTIAEPFAGFRTIYLPASLDDTLRLMALRHEAAHLQNRHTYVRLLLHVSQLLFWWHPLHWWYARQIEQVQEFQADAMVCQSFDKKSYSRSLLLANLSVESSIWPSLLQSPLKKRIEMLLSTVPKRPFTIVQGLGLSVLLSLLLVACTGLADSTPSTWEALPLLEEAELDQAPTYQGFPIDTDEGEVAMISPIYQTVSYPAVAREQGLEAWYVVFARIDAQGRYHIDKMQAREGKQGSGPRTALIFGYGTPAELDASKTDYRKAARALRTEVERVLAPLKASQKWQPAIKNGKPVSVRFSHCLSFRLMEKQ